MSTTGHTVVRYRIQGSTGYSGLQDKVGYRIQKGQVTEGGRKIKCCTGCSRVKDTVHCGTRYRGFQGTVGYRA